MVLSMVVNLTIHIKNIKISGIDLDSRHLSISKVDEAIENIFHEQNSNSVRFKTHPLLEF